jgi:hypothetical protein
LGITWPTIAFNIRRGLRQPHFLCDFARGTDSLRLLSGRAGEPAVSSQRSRRLIAWRFWWSVSFGLRPIFTPFALARSRPSPVRALINSRSNSASPL